MKMLGDFTGGALTPQVEITPDWVESLIRYGSPVVTKGAMTASDALKYVADQSQSIAEKVEAAPEGKASEELKTAVTEGLKEANLANASENFSKFLKLGIGLYILKKVFF